MSNFNKHLNNDYFKIGRADNNSTVRNINLGAFSILAIIALNIVFFFVVYTTTYYSHLGEIETIIRVLFY